MSKKYANYGEKKLLKKEVKALKDLDERLDRSVYKWRHSLTVEKNKVVKLNLDYSSACDISPVRNLKHLKTLHLGETNISDLTPLKDLQNLKEVGVDYNVESKNKDVVKKLEEQGVKVSWKL